MERIEQAIILAAGEGQRLRPFTATRPKVMIPIANKPMLRYVVEAVAANGIRKILMVVGYKKEQVINYFGAGEQFNVGIDYVEQKQQLGTAHALKQAKGKVNGKFLILSGDNIIDRDTISGLVHAEANTILVKEQEDVSKYGVVEVRDGMVTNVEEKPQEALSHLANTGIYAFSDEIFDLIKQETDMTSVIRAMIDLGHKVKMCEASGIWLDVVYPWDMLKLNDIALDKIATATAGTIESGVTIKGPVSIGKGTIIRSNSYIVGPAIIGENCEIGPSVCVLPSSSLGNHVCILPFTVINNSVLADRVEIGPSSTIQDSVIDRGCQIKGHFVTQSSETEIKVDGEYHRVHVGAMLGEHCTIGSNVVVAPGITVGNRSRVKALRVLEQNIPDGSLVV
ncbi:MAG: bifunctional sugar-1-phosphate nucleotidylyltransferase/acetyltransferase [Chloroflexota bacterium]|nr:bifunctional sugar-1-phosphate nucleotidylyltransferase/acetyltransferase [Chloroflexota bacterium]